VPREPAARSWIASPRGSLKGLRRPRDSVLASAVRWGEQTERQG
jgi:hypothetical protein